MSGRIPEQFIDELLARIDIVDVIEQRVPLRKAGRDWSARCPFHDERSPSFTVSPAKQFYHCFGCGAHGSAIKFLMDYDRMEFVDAVEDLAARAGLKVPYEGGGKRAPTEDSTDLYTVLDAAAKFYQRELSEERERTCVFRLARARCTDDRALRPRLRAGSVGCIEVRTRHQRETHRPAGKIRHADQWRARRSTTASAIA